MAVRREGLGLEDEGEGRRAVAVNAYCSHDRSSSLLLEWDLAYTRRGNR